MAIPKENVRYLCGNCGSQIATSDDLLENEGGQGTFKKVSNISILLSEKYSIQERPWATASCFACQLKLGLKILPTAAPDIDRDLNSKNGFFVLTLSQLRTSIESGSTSQPSYKCGTMVDLNLPPEPTEKDSSDHVIMSSEADEKASGIKRGLEAATGKEGCGFNTEAKIRRSSNLELLPVTSGDEFMKPRADSVAVEIGKSQPEIARSLSELMKPRADIVAVEIGKSQPEIVRSFSELMKPRTGKAAVAGETSSGTKLTSQKPKELPEGSSLAPPPTEPIDSPPKNPSPNTASVGSSESKLYTASVDSSESKLYTDSDDTTEGKLVG